MVNIIKEDLDIEGSLKKKLEFVCSFCNTKCEIQKGLNDIVKDVKDLPL